MRWVKLTFASVERASWSLSCCRLTSRSLAGTVRTEVAVGDGEARLHVLDDTCRSAPQAKAASTWGAASIWSRRGSGLRRCGHGHRRAAVVGEELSPALRDRARARRRTSCTCRRPATRSARTSLPSACLPRRSPHRRSLHHLCLPWFDATAGPSRPERPERPVGWHRDSSGPCDDPVSSPARTGSRVGLPSTRRQPSASRPGPWSACTARWTGHDPSLGSPGGSSPSTSWPMTAAATRAHERWAPARTSIATPRTCLRCSGLLAPGARSPSSATASAGPSP